MKMDPLIADQVLADLECQVKQRKKRIDKEADHIKGNLEAHGQKEVARDEDYVHTLAREHEHEIHDEQLVNSIVSLKNLLSETDQLENISIKRRLWSVLYALHSSECFTGFEEVTDLLDDSLLFKFVHGADDEHENGDR
jgi:hypothetical protein